EKLGIEFSVTAEDGSKMLLEYGKHYELEEWAAYPSEYDDDDDWLEGEVANGTSLSDIVDKGSYALTFAGIEPYTGTVTIDLRVVDARELRFARISGLQSGSVYHENFVVNPEVYTIDVDWSTNRELFASDNADMMADLKAGYEPLALQSGSMPHDVWLMSDEVYKGAARYAAGSRVMTDDKAPVELLSMQAIDGIIYDETAYFKDIYREKGIKGVIDALN
ncbi:MAG: hypothetical protein IKX89_05420, partial [Firmicutes bacterium]|nr:hypothetical protein [Bacillota bacterium]